MPRPPFLLAALLLLGLVTGCYEDRVGCTDVNAANYDLFADDLCEDGCCEFPDLRLAVTYDYNGRSIGPGDTVRLDNGQDITLLNLRYYLDDLSLDRGAGNDPGLPQRPQEVLTFFGTDTTLTEVNVDVYLGELGRTEARSVGSLPIGDRLPTGLSFAYGLNTDLNVVVPSSAPSGSPLRTQPGLLNFNDGRGYVQLRLQYVSAGDTLSVSSYAYTPASIPLPTDLELPAPGQDLTIGLRADVAALLRGFRPGLEEETAAELLRGNLAGFLAN